MSEAKTTLPLVMSEEDVKALALALGPVFRAAGLAVVPLEPTEAMLDAGASPGWSRWETRGRYRAMVEASDAR